MEEDVRRDRNGGGGLKQERNGEVYRFRAKVSGVGERMADRVWEWGQEQSGKLFGCTPYFNGQGLEGGGEVRGLGDKGTRINTGGRWVKKGGIMQVMQEVIDTVKCNSSK